VTGSRMRLVHWAHARITTRNTRKRKTMGTEAAHAMHDCDSCGKPRALPDECFCPVCKPVIRENTHPPRLYRVRGAMGLPTHYHAQLITTDERFEFVSAAWPSVLAMLPDNWRLIEITPAK